MTRKLRAPTVYVAMQAGTAFLRTMMGTIFAVYLIIDVGLDAFQLVILGTALEGAVLLFEVPTGVVADAVSRRASVIVGMFVQGAGFMVMGAIPRFWPVLLAQVLWGLGFTFTSGADVAWITDEVGEKAAHRLYVRAAQAAQAAALVGIGAAVGLGTISLGLPIFACGAGLAVLGLVLLVVMPEDHFQPTPRVAGVGMGRRFGKQFGEGIRTVRARPVLWLIFAVAAFHGMSTEGFDRLFQLHLIRGVGIPGIGRLDVVVWFGIIEAVGLLLAIGASEYVKRRVDISSHRGAARALAAIDVFLMAGVVGFALTGSFAVALAAFWSVSLLREVREPIFTAWVNQGLDPATRATVNSMGSQMDAIGQIAGGPGIGWLAVARSVPAALVVSGLLRAPALLLFARALRRGSVGTLAPEEIEPTGVDPVVADATEAEAAGLPGPE